MSVNKINFNSDLGEQDREFFEDIDQFLIPQINSANVSCLFHGGHKDVVLDVLKSCKQKNVSIGAHASFLDKKNFGRAIVSWDRPLIHQLLKDQINFMKDQNVLSLDQIFLLNICLEVILKNMLDILLKSIMKLGRHIINLNL